MQNFVSIQTRTSLKKSDVSWPIDEKSDVSCDLLLLALAPLDGVLGVLREPRLAHAALVLDLVPHRPDSLALGFHLCFSNFYSNCWLCLANFERLVLGCVEAEFCK